MNDKVDRLRVLVVASWYPFGATLGGTFVADQVDALRSRFDVAVIAPRIKRWRDFSTNRVSLPPRALGDVDRPIARPSIPHWPPAGARAYEAALERAYGRSVEEVGRPDIIHAHVTFPGGFAAAKVGKRHGIPVVLTEHSSGFSKDLRSSYVEQSTRWTLREVARVIAVSPALRDQILRFSPERRIDVLGNVIDTEFFTPGNDTGEMSPNSAERPLRIFTIGLNAPIKGVDILLGAIRLLVDDDLVVELVVAGGGPSRAGLEDRCRDLGLEDSCRFVGSLSRSDIRDRLRWCDLYVSASRYETFGVAIAEAIACARPVVVTRSGGPESFVEPEFGVFVEPGDPRDLAAAIRAVASGNRRLDGGTGRRRISERFGREPFLDNLEAIYVDITR